MGTGDLIKSISMDSNSLRWIEFADNNTLVTNLGPIKEHGTNSNPSMNLKDSLSPKGQLSVQGSWIQLDGLDILYIPFQYRDGLVEVRNKHVAFAAKNGKVYILRICAEEFAKVVPHFSAIGEHAIHRQDNSKARSK
ncbi:hypothetical protein K461DRAFT_279163 [Myriangium duriaei CBS 260.36]|uniref:Uncharacterized protein n=1 Tax=Myriangium duriaei CBS 260.36 TaxID=1168546 RepID=A0A9P4MJ32_9PEZI|nr:hypothetical protein K461DRAFT_279163 [Myriangium duriaei CBS 260.36]